MRCGPAPALAILTVLACAQPAPVTTPSNTAPPRASGGSSDAPALPGDVATLVDRWTNCWHFRGEDANGNPARQQEILDGVNAWCPNNDAERARLRTKYRGRGDVLAALDALDAMQ
jgi:hypothetical protein